MLVCLVAVASLPCNEDFPYCRSITKICFFARSFWLIGPLTLPVFGLEPSLSWVAPFKATGLPQDYESVAVQEREHVPRGGPVQTLCAPRHTS